MSTHAIIRRRMPSGPGLRALLTRRSAVFSTTARRTGGAKQTFMRFQWKHVVRPWSLYHDSWSFSELRAVAGMKGSDETSFIVTSVLLSILRCHVKSCFSVGFIGGMLRYVMPKGSTPVSRYLQLKHVDLPTSVRYGP